MDAIELALLEQAKKFSDEGLDQKNKEEFYALIEEIEKLQSKRGELDEMQTIRLKYAYHKLETLFKSGMRLSLEISPSTDEILVEEIRLFREVVQSGKEYFDVTIEFPKDVTEETLMLLKSTFGDLNNKSILVIRNLVPRSLIESLIAFRQIKVEFTDTEETERTLINLRDSESLLGLAKLYLDFQWLNYETAFERIPLLAAEICNKRGVDVHILFSFSNGLTR
jgi:hypothetical protein